MSKNISKKNKQRGFSLIEILMVLILIAVLATIAINAFVNFRTEAREASLRADLHVLRTAIATQYAQMQLRCNTASGVFPPIANITANDITSGASPCTTTQVPTVSERQFVQGGIPIPPFGTVNTVTAVTSVAGNLNAPRTANCAGVANGAGSKNWCYNAATGDIWYDDSTTGTGAASYWNY